MDRAAKILARLSRGDIGEDNARILAGTLILALLLVSGFAFVLAVVD
jgi:hypothetical protein